MNPRRSTDASPAWRFVAGERAAGVVSRPPSAPHGADRYQRQTSSRIACSQRAWVRFRNLDPKTRPSMHTASQAFGNRPRWPAGGRSPHRACRAGGTFSSPRSGHTRRQESFACLASLAPRLVVGVGETRTASATAGRGVGHFVVVLEPSGQQARSFGVVVSVAEIELGRPSAACPFLRSSPSSARYFASTLVLPLKARWSRRASSPPQAKRRAAFTTVDGTQARSRATCWQESPCPSLAIMRTGGRRTGPWSFVLAGSVAVARRDPVGVTCPRDGLLHDRWWPRTH